MDFCATSFSVRRRHRYARSVKTNVAFKSRDRECASVLILWVKIMVVLVMIITVVRLYSGFYKTTDPWINSVLEYIYVYLGI